MLAPSSRIAPRSRLPLAALAPSAPSTLLALVALASCGADAVPSVAGEEAWPAALRALRARASGAADAGTAIPRPERLGLLPLLSEARVAELFPLGQSFQYDSLAYFRHPPFKVYELDWAEHPDGRWIFRTDSLGLREDGELGERRPDRLVLVTGDSHTDGVCNNRESYPNRLEALLARAHPGRTVEVLNAGVGYYTFTNYLGTLVRFLPLEPDVFVVGVFGGNDLAEQLVPRHAFAGGERPSVGGDYMDRLRAAQAVQGGAGTHALGQGLNQIFYFHHLPEQAEIALAAAREHLVEMQRICNERGIAFVLLYLPPPVDAAGPELAPLFEELRQVLGLGPEDLALGDRLAERMLADARAAGIRVVDGRAALAGAAEPMYWRRDHHLSVAGLARLAEALAPVVGAALEGRER